MPHCLLGVTAAAGHCCRPSDCCLSNTADLHSGLCCPIWPSSVVTPCSWQLLLCFPSSCHCRRYAEGSQTPKLPSGTWNSAGDASAPFMCYILKGVSKPQYLSGVLTKSLFLISCVITCPLFLSSQNPTAQHLDLKTCARARRMTNTCKHPPPFPGRICCLAKLVLLTFFPFWAELSLRSFFSSE